MSEIVLVVPCYNEGNRLPVDKFVAYADSHAHISFVFVNDGSADHTGAVLEDLVRRDATAFTLLTLERNTGKGEAVRHGMRHALGRSPDLVGYWDADLATPLAEVDAMATHFGDDPKLQLLLGSRVLMMGREIERRAVRHYSGRVFATVVSLMLRLPVYDTQCGAKLFRANDVTRELFGDPFLTRWIFDVEIIARLKRIVDPTSTAEMAKAMREHPLTEWHDVPGGNLRLRDFFRATLDLRRIYRHYLP